MQEIKPVSPTLRYQPLGKSASKKLALSLFTWDGSDMFTVIIRYVRYHICKKIKSRTKSPHWNPFFEPAHQGQPLKFIPKKGYPNPGNQHLTLSNLCLLLKLGGKTWKEHLYPLTLIGEWWIPLKTTGIKGVQKVFFFGKLVVTCLSTLSLLRTFQSGQLICGMQGKKNYG